MSIQDIGSLGEFLAAFATIATLIYLSRQIRANTKASQTESRLGITRDQRANNLAALDPSYYRALVNGLHSFPDIDFSERGIFSLLMANEALHFQGIYAQFENGQLESETYEAYLDNFASFVATPGGANIWNETMRPVYVPKMVRAVDDRLAKGGLLDVIKLPQYRHDGGT
jgi:hypothetical protein